MHSSTKDAMIWKGYITFRWLSDLPVNFGDGKVLARV